MKGLSVEEWTIARRTFAKVVEGRLRNSPWVIPKTVVLLTATANKAYSSAAGGV
jgi:hypothetical protein